jgi:hypothetical protein
MQAHAARVPASDAGSGGCVPCGEPLQLARTQGGDRFRPRGRGGSLKRAGERAADFSARSPPALPAGTAPPRARRHPGASRTQREAGVLVQSSPRCDLRPATGRPLGAWSVPGPRVKARGNRGTGVHAPGPRCCFLVRPAIRGPCDDVGQADVRERRSTAFRAHSEGRKGLDGPDSTGQERDLPSPATVLSRCWLCRMAGTASFPLSPEGSANAHSVDERALLSQAAIVVTGPRNSGERRGRT